MRTLDRDALLEFVGVPDLPLARRWMCERLAAANISHEVLSAMAAIPRHCFAPPHRWPVAYLDVDLWTGATWMTAPGTVARVVDAMPRLEGSRILEIGTGTGYQSALLAHLATHVVSNDLSPVCVAWAAERLTALDARGADVALGDGFGAHGVSPGFDAIAVNAALPAVPTALFELLSPGGGVIVAPVACAGSAQRLVRWTVPERGTPTMVDLGACRFPPAVLAVSPMRRLG
jgi:protein-L-isoaspartate(D-aspartate) O-methyltransferase